MAAGEEVLAELRRRGYRLTPQRTLIIEEIMRNVERHISLRELHALINSKLPGVSISTVHQTLKILEELGFIKLFEVDGRLHIDKPEVHANVVCRDTGEIVDVDGELKQIVEVLRRKGIEPRNILIEAYCKPGSTSR
jgi:Fe2+ or Zn2+ uptake regulation protein